MTASLSPSETLRAAAEKLREMAEKATPGPWRWNGSQVDVEPTTRGTYVVGDGMQEDDVVTPEDGAWIATLSPAVAEPLAAWLEIEAEHTPMWEEFYPAGQRRPHALAFARCILEGQDD